MATGTVKWSNESKGFGFIAPDGGGKDVFCHQSAIRTPGVRSLSDGQKVEFDVKQGPKGPQADNVKVVARARVSRSHPAVCTKSKNVTTEAAALSRGAGS